jgi:hypothetical protein
MDFAKKVRIRFLRRFIHDVVILFTKPEKAESIPEYTEHDVDMERFVSFRQA